MMMVMMLVVLVIMVLLMMMGMQFFQPPRKSQRLPVFRAGCLVQPATSSIKELADVGHVWLLIGSGCDAQLITSAKDTTELWNAHARRNKVLVDCHTFRVLV